MTSREKILGRIREALQARAPVPGHHGATQHEPPQTGTGGIRNWLPQVDSGWEQQRDLFAQNSVALKTEFKVVPDAVAAAAELKRMAEAGQWKRIAAHHNALLVEALALAGVETLWADAGVATPELESCDAGLTGCEALVAQTGSVLVTSRGSGGRALSVLPPHHVVLASRDQLVPDLLGAFELMRRKYEGNFPSMMSFVTGPSRTGDIERILVLGAHGPKRLTVLCIA